jgi:predicted transcriptional regulator
MADSSGTFSVRLPDSLRREVDDFAKATKQKAYLAAIDEALAEADKGVFISGEAVSKWLASWGTPDELPPPEPDIFLNRKS